MIFSWWFFKIWPKLVIFKFWQKWRFFKFGPKLMIFSNFWQKWWFFKIWSKLMAFQILIFCVILNFQIHLSVECCGVVLFRQHFCGVVWNWYHTTLLDSLIVIRILQRWFALMDLNMTKIRRPLLCHFNYMVCWISKAWISAQYDEWWQNTSIKMKLL